MSNQIGKAQHLSRRSFLTAAAFGVGGTLLAACVPLAPGQPAAGGAQAPVAENAPIIYWSMFGLQEAEQAQKQVERFNEESGENAIFMSIGWGNVAQKAQVAIEGGQSAGYGFALVASLYLGATRSPDPLGGICRA